MSIAPFSTNPTSGATVEQAALAAQRAAGLGANTPNIDDLLPDWVNEYTRKPEATPATERQRRFGARGIAAVLAGGVVLSGLTYAVVEANNDPYFSSETTSVIVPEGGGVQDAAATIEGLTDIAAGENYIESLPANQDVLADGLQPGEPLVVPLKANDWVKPS